MKQYLIILLILCAVLSCGRRGIWNSVGVELTGVTVGMIWDEPTPYNLVLINRGSINMGPGEPTRFGASLFPPWYFGR